MMDDQDLEARLKAYRPGGPPPALRARVVAGGVPPGVRPVLAWIPAAAAVLAATMLYWLAAAGRERVLSQLPAGGAGQAIELNLEVQP